MNLIRNPKYRIYRSICICFLTTALISASVPVADVVANSVPIQPTISVSKDVIIPSDFGTVEQFFKGHRKKFVVYIQDAHDSLDAQKSIAGIISHLVTRYDVKTVYEEGYEGPVPTDKFFSSIANRETREKVAFKFLDELRIGGAEYAHINRGKDFKLIGADDVRLHLKNVERYRDAADLRNEVEIDLQLLEQSVSNLIASSFPGEMQKWMKWKERFEENQLGLADYVKRMKALFPIPTSDYIHLDLLIRASDPLAEEEIEELRSVPPNVIFEELRKFENKNVEFFLKTERDRKLFMYDRGIKALKQLNSVSLNPAEYQGVKETLKKLQTEELAQFIARETQKTVILSKHWEAYIQNAVAFYEVAEARDRAVVKALENFLQDSDEKMTVLVFGGFHKSQIEKALAEKGISFLTVSPKISEISERHISRYKKLMSSFTGSEVRRASPPVRLFEQALLSGDGIIQREIMERSENVLTLAGFGMNRPVITDARIRESVKILLADKKEHDEKTAPYVHYPYVSIQAVSKAMGLQSRGGLLNYFNRHKKTLSDFKIFQPTKVLNAGNVLWAVRQIKQKKEERNRGAADSQKTVRISASAREVGRVFGLSKEAVEAFLEKNPSPDFYGILRRPPVDEAKREGAVRTIVERLLREEGIVRIEDLVEPSGLSLSLLEKMRPKLYAWGVSPPRFLIRHWKSDIKALTPEAREDLIAFILYLRDETVISFSQAYALVHLIHYLDTPLDSNNKIAEVLKLPDANWISELLHGTSPILRPRQGALLVLEDQPEIQDFLRKRKPIPAEAAQRLRGLLKIRGRELPPFYAKFRPDEKSSPVIEVRLDIAQRIKIVEAALNGKTRKQIARELPNILEDLRFQKTSASSVSYFLRHEEHRKETKGAIDLLSQALEDEGAMVGRQIQENALRKWAQETDATYRAAARRIRLLPTDEKRADPGDVVSIINVLERKRRPFAQFVRSFLDYAERQGYPFDLDVVAYPAIAEVASIGDKNFALEVSNYFSTYVLPATGKPDEFMDALLYMLQPARTHYYLDADETAAFIANAYFAIERSDEKKIWGQAFARGAAGTLKKQAGRGHKYFARKIYAQFLRIVFPRLRFVTDEHLKQATFAERRRNILVSQAREYDFNHLVEVHEAYQNKVIEVDRRIRALLQKTSFERIAKVARIPEQEIDLVYEAVTEAAWDYDPSLSRAAFETVATEYAIRKARQWRARKASLKSEMMPQFTLSEEGQAVELEITPGPDQTPLAEMLGGEHAKYMDERIVEMKYLLDTEFSAVEQLVFRLANGIHTDYGVALHYGQIAEVLWNEGLTTGEESVSASRIEQIYRGVIDKLVRLMNEPSAQDLADWNQYFHHPELDRTPPPIRVDVKDGKIPISAAVQLTGYKAKEDRPVVVTPVQTHLSPNPHDDYYVVVEVSYLGKSLGVSILKFNSIREFRDQIKIGDRKKVNRILASLTSESENAGNGFGANVKRRTREHEIAIVDPARKPFADPALRKQVEDILYIELSSLTLGQSVITSSLLLHAMRNTFPNLKRLRVATVLPELYEGEDYIDQVIRIPSNLTHGEKLEFIYKELLPSKFVFIDTGNMDDPTHDAIAFLMHGWDSQIRGRRRGARGNAPILIYETDRIRGNPKLWRAGENRWIHLPSYVDLFTQSPLNYPKYDLSRKMLKAAGFEMDGGTDFKPSDETKIKGKEILEAVFGKTLQKPVLLVSPHGNFVPAILESEFPNVDLDHYWSNLIKKLSEQKDAVIFLLAGTPGLQADESRLSRLRVELERNGTDLSNVHILPALNVAELKSVLAASDYLIGLQSGPVHLAEALGTPAIVVSYDRWGDGYLHDPTDKWKLVVATEGTVPRAVTKTIRELRTIKVKSVSSRGFGSFSDEDSMESVSDPQDLPENLSVAKLTPFLHSPYKEVFNEVLDRFVKLGRINNARNIIEILDEWLRGAGTGKTGKRWSAVRQLRKLRSQKDRWLLTKTELSNPETGRVMLREDDLQNSEYFQLRRAETELFERIDLVRRAISKLEDEGDVAPREFIFRTSTSPFGKSYDPVEMRGPIELKRPGDLAGSALQKLKDPEARIHWDQLEKVSVSDSTNLFFNERKDVIDEEEEMEFTQEGALPVASRKTAVFARKFQRLRHKKTGKIYFASQYSPNEVFSMMAAYLIFDLLGLPVGETHAVINPAGYPVILREFIGNGSRLNTFYRNYGRDPNFSEDWKEILSGALLVDKIIGNKSRSPSGIYAIVGTDGTDSPMFTGMKFALGLRKSAVVLGGQDIHVHDYDFSRLVSSENIAQLPKNFVGNPFYEHVSQMDIWKMAQRFKSVRGEQIDEILNLTALLVPGNTFDIEKLSDQIKKGMSVAKRLKRPKPEAAAAQPQPEAETQPDDAIFPTPGDVEDTIRITRAMIDQIPDIEQLPITGLTFDMLNISELVLLLESPYEDVFKASLQRLLVLGMDVLENMPESVDPTRVKSSVDEIIEPLEDWIFARVHQLVKIRRDKDAWLVQHTALRFPHTNRIMLESRDPVNRTYFDLRNTEQHLFLQMNKVRHVINTLKTKAEERKLEFTKPADADDGETELHAEDIAPSIRAGNFKSSLLYRLQTQGRGMAWDDLELAETYFNEREENVDLGDELPESADAPIRPKRAVKTHVLFIRKFQKLRHKETGKLYFAAFYSPNEIFAMMSGHLFFDLLGLPVAETHVIRNKEGRLAIVREFIERGSRLNTYENNFGKSPEFSESWQRVIRGSLLPFRIIGDKGQDEDSLFVVPTPSGRHRPLFTGMKFSLGVPTTVAMMPENQPVQLSYDFSKFVVPHRRGVVPEEFSPNRFHAEASNEDIWEMAQRLRYITPDHIDFIIGVVSNLANDSTFDLSRVSQEWKKALHKAQDLYNITPMAPDRTTPVRILEDELEEYPDVGQLPRGLTLKNANRRELTILILSPFRNVREAALNELLKSWPDIFQPRVSFNGREFVEEGIGRHPEKHLLLLESGKGMLSTFDGFATMKTFDSAPKLTYDVARIVRGSDPFHILALSELHPKTGKLLRSWAVIDSKGEFIVLDEAPPAEIPWTMQQGPTEIADSQPAWHEVRDVELRPSGDIKLEAIGPPLVVYPTLAGFGVEHELSGPDATLEAIAYLKEKISEFKYRQSKIEGEFEGDELTKRYDDLDKKIYVLEALLNEVQDLAEKNIHRLSYDVLEIADREAQDYDRKKRFDNLYEQFERLAMHPKNKIIISPQEFDDTDETHHEQDTEHGFGIANLERVVEVRRAIRTRLLPAVVFVQAKEWLEDFSQAQRDELLVLAHEQRQVRFVIYGAHIFDPRFSELQGLANVHLRSESASDAFQRFGKREGKNVIHISKSGGTIKRQFDDVARRRIKFFRYQDEKSGTLAVALLYSISDDRVLGAAMDGEGFYVIANDYIRDMVAQYLAGYVIARAA